MVTRTDQPRKGSHERTNMTTFNKEKRFYVYIKLLEDKVIYVGKGTGNRSDSKKNEAYNALTEGRDIDTVYPFSNITSLEAETLEAKLIRKYRPIFNQNLGRSEKKWITFTEADLADIKKNGKKYLAPDASETPEALATEMVKNIGSKVYKNVLLLDRYGNIWVEFKKRFPNFKGQVTVIETQQDRLPGFDNQAYSVVPDFMAHDFRDEHFDLILMNPPFTKNDDGKKDNMLWNKFLSKATSMADTVAFLAPIGAAGKTFYGKQRYKISYMRLLEEHELGISQKGTLGVWHKNSVPATEVPGVGIIDRETFKNYIPESGVCDDKTYTELFDQENGVKTKHTFDGTQPTHKRTKNFYGIYRMNGEFRTGWVHESLKKYDRGSMDFIPFEKDEAKIVAKRLNRAERAGRLNLRTDGYYSNGYMADVNRKRLSDIRGA